MNLDATGREEVVEVEVEALASICIKIHNSSSPSITIHVKDEEAILVLMYSTAKRGRVG